MGLWNIPCKFHRYCSSRSLDRGNKICPNEQKNERTNEGTNEVDEKSENNAFADTLGGKDINKKLSYRRGTARRAASKFICVSRRMGVRKVSNSKSDLQGHSRALAVVPFDMPHTISY